MTSEKTSRITDMCKPDLNTGREETSGSNLSTNAINNASTVTGNIGHVKSGNRSIEEPAKEVNKNSQVSTRTFYTGRITKVTSQTVSQ